MSEVKDNIGEKFRAKTQRKNTRPQRIFASLREKKLNRITERIPIKSGSDTKDEEQNY
ncbi:MAG TPA: hypothetical protein VFH08_07520 [Chitinophagaceae bacterium]|nr:hypothetical protein [Chitinophagaceae bacterium]